MFRLRGLAFVQNKASLYSFSSVLFALGKWALIILSLLAPLSLGAHAKALPAKEGGVTVTPAALTLSLQKGQAAQSAEFVLINTYDTPVNLHLSVEQSTDGHKPAKFLALSNSDITVRAGESLGQTVTLHDSAQLSSGSQMARLVITQTGTSTGVAILPQFRLPVTIVKQDGAVSSLGLVGLTRPGAAMAVPKSLSVTLENTGNMVATPRGFVTVANLRGEIIAKGTINVISKTVAPGERIQLHVPLSSLTNSAWPGVYRTTISFGLGGDQVPATMTARFLYIAWWHILSAAAALAAAYYLLRSVRNIYEQRAANRKEQAALKPALVTEGELDSEV